jgi:protein PsiE
LNKSFDKLGDVMVDVFHQAGLFIIGACIVWATAVEILNIIDHGGPSIKDVLLLFIYLELGAMVGIYFRTHSLPVRYLIYIAITALTRVLAVDAKEMSDIHMFTLTGAILLLCVAVLVLRYGSARWPSPRSEADSSDA